MRPHTPLPAALPPSFTVATARAHGISAKRLRGTDLQAPFHGVRSTALPPTNDRYDRTRALCAAFATRMPAHVGFSHLTAMRLFGLPEPSRLQADERLHATAIAPHRAPKAAGVRGYQMSIALASTPGTLLLRDGLRVVAPLDTWCQMASQLDRDELVVLGDALVRRQRPLAGLAELEAAVARYAGARGARRLAEALPLIRPGTDSPRETTLRLALLGAGLPEPEVNTRIYDDAGLPIARGDLVYRTYKVLVEYDGGQHQEDSWQYYSDIDRLDRLAEAGWRVIRVNKTHRGARLEEALQAIRRALVERGWTPPH